jgi:AmmeMemoRadiSam system protein A
MMNFFIPENDQKLLLQHARTTIEKCFYPQKEFEAIMLSTTLRCGAFVTLNKIKSLRGCIGRMKSNSPILETVAEMAYAAAFEDPRFPPLREDELALIRIEITLLSPLMKTSPHEVVIGKHGLLISAMGRSGVLLPQVPLEFGWDRVTFLEQVCLKAGLPIDIYNSPSAALYGFEGFVFSE